MVWRVKSELEPFFLYNTFIYFQFWNTQVN